MAVPVWISIVLVTLPLIQGDGTEEQKSSNPNFTITVSSSARVILPQGSDFNFTCTIHQHRVPSSSFFIKWRREFNGQSDIIGTSNHVTGAYEASGRYSAAYTFEVPDVLSQVTFTLTILNVTTAENGQFFCELMDGAVKVSGSRNLSVYEDVKSIEMSNWNPDGSFDFMTPSPIFNEGEEVNVACLVSGSYPAPNVSVTSGDLDLTTLFQRNETLKSRDNKGMTEHYYDVTMKATLEVDYHLNQYPLTCVAEVPGGFYNSHESEVQFRLTGYKPQFLCKDHHVVAFLAVDFELSCIIRADPPITNAEFQFADSETTNRTIKAGDIRTKYHIVQKAVPGENANINDMLLTLHILRIHEYHFRKYYLIAENSLGVNQFVVELIRDQTPTSKPMESRPKGGSSGLRASLPTSLLAVLAPVFLTTPLSQVR